MPSYRVMEGLNASPLRLAERQACHLIASVQHRAGNSHESDDARIKCTLNRKQEIKVVLLTVPKRD